MRKLLSLAAAFSLAGCVAQMGYVDGEDAPELVKAGVPDLRVAVSRIIGEPLLPVIDAMPYDPGALPKIGEFRNRFFSEARPLDLILVRTPPGISNTIIPSHFTHSGIWLGTEAQLRREGLWGAKELDGARKPILQGKFFYEAAGKAVKFSGSETFLERDEVLILRPTYMSRAEKVEAIRRALGFKGVTFDIAFDKADDSRLTCIELAEKVYSRLNLPVRYTFGRFVTIPDDAARGAIEGKLPFRIVKHFAAGKDGKLEELDPAETMKRLTSPRERPPLPYF